MRSINTFCTTGLLLYYPKNIRKPPDFFRRYRKRPVALNGLNNEGEGELHEIKRSRGKMEIDKEII